MESLVLNLFNGLSWGMLLFLISIGLTIIFGVLGVLNFAHGSFFMLGAYLCMQMMSYMKSFWTGIIIGPLLVAFLGILVEKFLLKKIYDRDISFQLLLTFAILLVLDDSVRLIWGSGYYVIEPPQVLSGVINIFSHTYPVYRIFLIIIGPVIGLSLLAFFKYTKYGKIIRASALDKEMAEGIGINVSLVFTSVFAFGAWLSALGGALAAPHQSLAPSMGERIIIESFIVVVVGGFGSFTGAFAGAIFIGLLESFGTMFAGRLQMALPYILLIVILLVKPNGLFKKGT